jgi:hypothetical protein
MHLLLLQVLQRGLQERVGRLLLQLLQEPQASAPVSQRLLLLAAGWLVVG